MHTIERTQIRNSTARKMIIIEKIELQTESRRILPVPRRHHLEFFVGSVSQMTKTAEEKGTHTFWNETLCFDVENQSMIFTIKVIQDHRARRDETIGALIATVGGVVARLRSNILEEPIYNNTSNGYELLGTKIKFSLVVKEHDDIGLDADSIQAKHTLDKAIRESNKLGLGPRAVSKVDCAILKHQDAFSALLDTLKRFNEITTAIPEIYPYATLAWSVISTANKAFLKQQENDEQIIRLTSVMKDVFEFVHDAKSLKKIKAHIKVIRLLTQQVTECGYFIAEYTRQKSFWIRTAKYTLTDISGKVTAYQNKLKVLKAAFLEGVTLQTGIMVICMMNVVRHVAEAIDLNDMPYAHGAGYVEKKGCLRRTHGPLLSDIQDILNDSDKDTPQLCLLTGAAGSGKSTIAHSIAHLYDGQKRLGSSYCFSRTDLAVRNPQSLFNTIALDICNQDPRYKSALWGVVKDNRALRMSTSPLEQLERFIVEPSKHLDLIGPLIIVIDALDECSDPLGRQPLLRAISKQISENSLPRNLRLLITTRPESDILSALPSGPRLVHKQMDDVSDSA